MSTRRANPNAPLSQERYMSSLEFTELQGISGTAVAKRCALLLSPVKRQLLWFIQGMSLADGGLKKLVRELLKMFPERIVCPLRADIDWDSGIHEKITSEECLQLALGRWLWPEDREHPDVQSMEEFLINLCINPKLRIRLEQGELETSEFDIDLAGHEFHELDDQDFIDANLSYFRGTIGALVEYKRAHEERVRTEFCLTAIGQQVWKQVDAALKSRIMIVIDGLEGRGKTEAVRAWCNCHLGVARFISLKGTNTKTAHYREFSKAFGLGHGNSHKASQMQANVEEMLRVSQLMPVIDEAHFFFNQGPRMYTQPEMLDWIDTALCNPPLPVAPVTTPPKPFSKRPKPVAIRDKSHHILYAGKSGNQSRERAWPCISKSKTRIWKPESKNRCRPPAPPAPKRRCSGFSRHRKNRTAGCWRTGTPSIRKFGAA